MSKQEASSRSTRVSEDGAERTRAFVAHLLKESGYRVTLKSRVQGDRLILDVLGEDAENVISNNRDLLEALQHLGERVASNIESSHVAIQIDATDFRKRRQAIVGALAERLVEKVKEGVSLEIHGMTSVDRRVVHRRLTEDSAIETHSDGPGIYRRLQIKRR